MCLHIGSQIFVELLPVLTIALRRWTRAVFPIIQHLLSVKLILFIYGNNILPLTITKRQCGKEDGLKDKISYHLNALQNYKKLHTLYDSFGKLLWYWVRLRRSWVPFLLLTVGCSWSRYLCVKCIHEKWYFI